MKKRGYLAVFMSLLILALCVLNACDNTKTDDLKQESKIEQPKDRKDVDQVNPTEDPTNVQTEDPTEDLKKDEVNKRSSEYVLSQINLNQYSAPLQKVLSDEYYMYLRNVLGKDVFHGANKLKAIPYGNLNSLGYSNEDIYNIINDHYFAESFVYIKDGDLYVAFNAEHKPSSEVYCGSFLLKYTLTDQELYELKALHRDLWNCNSTYLEAPLFIQAMSQLKTPEVLSQAYITKDAIKGSLESCNDIRNVTYPKFILYTGKKQYKEYSLSEGGQYSMVLFVGNKANAVSNYNYIDLTTTNVELCKYCDGKDILNKKLDWESLLLKYNRNNTLLSSYVPITRLDSNKDCVSIYCAIDNWDINYLKNINYTNELNKK